MGIKGIDHWVIVVSDVSRIFEFYRCLELTIAWEARSCRFDDMFMIRINDA